ncbi:PREDICTED: uncharacterized protein LOC105626199 [Atta cephalotes]|uniref:Uncharacterized protein n=1 Tax=Atta cephalotes TaxID=12957 RepID=A0A158NZD9_ATTCE|nr:PREDICTED: uncharacterized protein LOC105626199 [Atta cephalotes]
MIKLFLITLLCVAMFADSQEDQMNEMGTGVRKARVDMAEHAAMSQDSPLLMQHATFDGNQEDEKERRQGRGRGRGRGRGKGRNGRGSKGQQGEN